MKGCILIVDTDPATEMLVEGSVDSSLDVEMVSDVKAAAEFIEVQAPALVMVNADLPKGWRFCTELKKKEESAGVPLVLISASATEEMFSEHQSLPTRANAYLAKPLDEAELRLSFVKLLSGEEVEYDRTALVEPSAAPEPTPIEAKVAPEPEAESHPEPEAESHPEPELESAPEFEPVQEVEPAPVTQQARNFERAPAQPQAAAAPASQANQSLVAENQALREALAQEKKKVAFLARKLKAAMQAQAQAGVTSSKAPQTVGLQKKVKELTLTANSLRDAHGQQTHAMETLRRQLEATEAEAAANRTMVRQRTEQLEMVSQQLQSAEDTTASQDELAELQAHVAAITRQYGESRRLAAETDAGLRDALAEYQAREAQLDKLRQQESGLTDVVLQVIEHVYQGLEGLKQDVHNGVPEIPAVATLPVLSSMIPPPLDLADLPSGPGGNGEVLDAALEPTQIMQAMDDEELTAEDIDALTEGLPIGMHEETLGDGLLDDTLAAELAELGIDMDGQDGDLSYEPDGD